MNALINTISTDELLYIARLDYGKDATRHEAELRSLVFEQDCQFREGQFWYPHEVLALGANHLTPGHEREFVICTLLIIHAVMSGFDVVTDLPAKFAGLAQQYDALPVDLRDELLSAYAEAGV